MAVRNDLYVRGLLDGNIINGNQLNIDSITINTDTVSSSGNINITGTNILVSQDPTTTLGVATKQYVDNEITSSSTGLTVSEIDQLKNIDLVTVNNTQWGYIGSSDQPISTTDAVNFAQVTVDQVSINDSTLTFTGASNIITAPDNQAQCLDIIDSNGTNYISIDSTTNNEIITMTQDVTFSNCIKLTDITEPPDPGTGFGKLYKKTTHPGLWWLPDNGVPLDVSAGSDRDIQISTTSIPTATTSTTYVDMNAMTVTTSNTEPRAYLVLFSAEFISAFSGRTIFIIVSIGGVDVSTTERRANYSSGGAYQLLSTLYRTESLGNGIEIKVRWHYENNKQLTCESRTLIIDGTN